MGGRRGGLSLTLGGVRGSGDSEGTGGTTVSEGLVTESPPVDLVRLCPFFEVRLLSPRRDGDASRCSGLPLMNGFDVERPNVDDAAVEGRDGP